MIDKKQKKLDMPTLKERLCCICTIPFIGHGNDARPLKEGLCCPSCFGAVLMSKMTDRILNPKKVTQ